MSGTGSTRIHVLDTDRGQSAAVSPASGAPGERASGAVPEESLPVRGHPAAPIWWVLMLVGGALGVVTATWQTVDRIAYAAGSGGSAVCELNEVLSCSSVYNHWQSSVLGIPNALIALPIFALLAATGLAGLMRSALSPAYLLTVLYLTLFMTGFITWYMQQTAFSIGVLCLFCLGCALNVIIAGIGVTRVAAAGRALGTGSAQRVLDTMVARRVDVAVWVGLAALIGAMLVVGLTG